jgi:hypothetical protein
MRKIENIDELVKFINNNFDRITEDEYYNICFKSLGLITRKPERVEDATAEILKFYDIIKDIPKGWERPFFALTENDFDE